MPKESPVKSSRYSMDEIITRISRMMNACRVGAPDVYRAIGMKQPAWNRKWHQTDSTFTVQELGAIADFFSRKMGRDLTGWPVVDAETADLLDALRRRD